LLSHQNQREVQSGAGEVRRCSKRCIFSFRLKAFIDSNAVTHGWCGKLFHAVVNIAESKKNNEDLIADKSTMQIQLDITSVAK